MAFMVSGYAREMNRKTAEYEVNLQDAKRLRREKGGPSVPEAECYNRAAKMCEEIMAMNLSGRDIYETWKRRRDDCVNMVREIANALRPAPTPAPAPAVPTAPRNFAQDRPVPNQQPEQNTQAPTAPGPGANPYIDGVNITAEMVKSWYKEAPTQGFDSIVGMEDVKRRLMEAAGGQGTTDTDSWLGLPIAQSFFLYGPPGTGKTTFINAFVKEVMENKKFHFNYIALTGSEIHNPLVGVAEKTVSAVFWEAVNNAPSIVFLDEVEGVCANRSNPSTASHEKRLTNAFLEARNKMHTSGKKVIFFGATNHPSDVDPAMMDSVNLIYVPLPDEKARASFFERRFSKLALEEGFSFAEMAGKTANSSYRELNMLSTAILFAVKGELSEAYRKQNPDGNAEELDAWMLEELKTGTAKLTRELFEKKLRENPPRDKTLVLDELKSFENGLTASLG